jgi:hypothetical protein
MVFEFFSFFLVRFSARRRANFHDLYVIYEGLKFCKTYSLIPEYWQADTTVMTV